MKKLNPNYISVESQSDIDSSSQSQKSSMNVGTNSRTFIKPIVVQDMYQRFTSSKFYLLTQSLKKYANQINDFLEMRKNVLFMFGPSGCGKGTLVRKLLAHNSITYDTVQQYENENDKIVPLSQAIIQTLQKIDSRKVFLCHDFPIHIQKWNANEIKQFKNKFSQEIKKTTVKIIFILNEQIYNSFYVLNQRSVNDQNLTNRENVSIIKMEKFGVLEIKRILKAFVDYQMLHNYVTLGKDFLDQVVQLANGDLRKALFMLYWKGVETKADKILKEQKKAINNAKLKRPVFVENVPKKLNKKLDFIEAQKKNSKPKYHSSLMKNNYQLENHSLSQFSSMSNSLNRIEKNPPKYQAFLKKKSCSQSRFSLYHGLGKLLYGKRLNVKNNPKNKKDISCYYSQKEIKQLDPPFYFDPIGLFQQLRVDLDIITKLLQENYLERFGKIKDIRKMQKIFVMQDGFFSFSHKIEDQQVKEIKVCLLTWGILIYNRNSRTDNLRFMKIQKSQSTNVDKKVAEKQRLIRQYFPQSHVRDVIKFAHLTRNTPSLLNDTIFNKSLSRSQVTRFDDHTKSIQNEEQQQQIETVMKLTANEIEVKLRKMVKDKQRKKKEMMQMLMQMEQQDDENIDDISSSNSDDDVREIDI